MCIHMSDKILFPLSYKDIKITIHISDFVNKSNNQLNQWLVCQSVKRKQYRQVKYGTDWLLNQSMCVFLVNKIY